MTEDDISAAFSELTADLTSQRLALAVICSMLPNKATLAERYDVVAAEYLLSSEGGPREPLYLAHLEKAFATTRTWLTGEQPANDAVDG
jgi:hypothetical protein